MTQPLRFAILGLGNRGREAYGGWILRHPERAVITAVADPLPERHDEAIAEGVAHFADWHDLLDALPDLAVDAVIVALPDRLHVEPMRRLATTGLPILLEKPIAPTVAGMDALVASMADDARVTVGHVLRFTHFWQAVHDVLRSGVIGEVVTFELRENIGFWHFAHSYVRGNWRKTADASPMVLAKTCHDLDLIRWLMGAAPESISSMGSLQYFTHRNQPEGAPDFCIDGCPVADSCPFYAPRYYVEAMAHVHGAPVSLLGPDTSIEGRVRALSHSNYGRCVFKSDNDVADHQSTVMSFPGGATAVLTASAFTAENTRHVTITGSVGQLAGNMDSGQLVVDLFSPTASLPPSLERWKVEEGRRGPLAHQSVELRVLPDQHGAGSDGRGHAGGDDGLMEAFVSALEDGTLQSTKILSLRSALDSHYMAFAAEESRLSGETIQFQEWMAQRGER